jgi:hypothetical protein
MPPATYLRERIAISSVASSYPVPAGCSACVFRGNRTTSTTAVDNKLRRVPRRELASQQERDADGCPDRHGGSSMRQACALPPRWVVTPRAAPFGVPARPPGRCRRARRGELLSRSVFRCASSRVSKCSRDFSCMFSALRSHRYLLLLDVGSPSRSSALCSCLLTVSTASTTWRMTWKRSNAIFSSAPGTSCWQALI